MLKIEKSPERLSTDIFLLVQLPERADQPGPVGEFRRKCGIVKNRQRTGRSQSRLRRCCRRRLRYRRRRITESAAVAGRTTTSAGANSSDPAEQSYRRNGLLPRAPQSGHSSGQAQGDEEQVRLVHTVQILQRRSAGQAQRNGILPHFRRRHSDGT